MVFIGTGNMQARTRLFHLRLQHLCDFLRHSCCCFNLNTLFQQSSFSIRTELSRFPNNYHHHAFLCNHTKRYRGYLTKSISSKCASSSTSFLTNHTSRLFSKGAILQLDLCSYSHIRQFSLSVERFADDSKDHDPTDTINKNLVKKLQRVEDSLRYHGYSTIRIGLFFMFVLGMSLYIFRESIRENVADEVSQVATRSLEDEMVVGKAEQFAKGLLDAIMNDEQMTRLAAEFVVGVLQRNETKQATAKVLLSVIDDPVTREHLIVATKQVFLAALYDNETQNALKVVFKTILADNETRQAAKDLLAFVFNEDDIKTMVADFLKEVIRMEVVVNQATELGKDVTHNVITDPVIQQETGDSMWRAFTYSITPRLFSGSPPSHPPAKETSPETGETESKSTQSAVEDKKQDTKSVEGKKDTGDTHVANQEKPDTEEAVDEQQKEVQGEIADLTLVAEDN